jgi:hypothetical protein
VKEDVPHFEIMVDKSGKVKLEAFGFKGDACLKASKELEDAIGSVDGRNYKSAFYQRVVAGVKKTLGVS